MCVRSGSVWRWVAGGVENFRERKTLFYSALADDSFALKSWKCFFGARVSLAGAIGRWVAGVGEKFMICVQRRRVHITTHISRRFSPKQRKFHERLCRPCLLGGWEKKERKNLYRCLLFGRAFVRCSIQSRWFSVVVHNENFRVKTSRVYILSFFPPVRHIKNIQKGTSTEYIAKQTFTHFQKKSFRFVLRALVDTHERDQQKQKILSFAMPIFNRHPVSLV